MHYYTVTVTVTGYLLQTTVAFSVVVSSRIEPCKCHVHGLDVILAAKSKKDDQFVSVAKAMMRNVHGYGK